MNESSLSRFVRRVTVGLFTTHKYEFHFYQAPKFGREVLARPLAKQQLRSSLMMKRVLRLGPLAMLRSAKFSTVACEMAAEHKLRAGSCNIPHPSKVKTGGEDAFFHDDTTVVVADGVGGWANWGVNSGDYSRSLCNHIKMVAADFANDPEATPKKILVSAALRTTVVGSSTCCLAMIDKKEKKLKVANIGDSGYLIARPQADNTLSLVHVSGEQLHSFNFPYQIGTEGDAPTKAQEFEHDLQEGDIIVLGTDGVFDNADEDTILQVLSEYLEEDRLIDVDGAAQAVGQKASDLSHDKSHLSPFAKKARRARYAYIGGKPDDITVIVAVAEFKEGEETA